MNYIENTEPLISVWGNGWCSASYDSFVVGSSAVIILNFCAKNPPHQASRKKIAVILQTTTNK